MPEGIERLVEVLFSFHENICTKIQTQNIQTYFCGFINPKVFHTFAIQNLCYGDSEDKKRMVLQGVRK
jgi:hypothetical protein